MKEQEIEQINKRRDSGALCVVLPKGEWQPWIKQMLQFAEPELEFSGSKGMYAISSFGGQPVIFTVSRPKEVAQVVLESGGNAVVGITGSDCWQESRLSLDSSPEIAQLKAEDNLPQPADFFRMAPRPRIAVMATPNATLPNPLPREPELIKLVQTDNQAVLTSPFPNLMRNFLGQAGPSIVRREGSQDAEWMINRRVKYNGDVIQTGRTAEETGQTQLFTVLAPVLIISLARAETDRAAQQVADFVGWFQRIPEFAKQYTSLTYPERDNYWNS